MAVKQVAHPSVDERAARGKEARSETPLSAQASFEATKNRPDPVTLLEQQNTTREPDLVPVRHGTDDGLAVHVLPGRGEDHGVRPLTTPNAGLTVQLCGDAHLSNFGVFASPERRLLFDLNDFDETLPGPFE